MRLSRIKIPKVKKQLKKHLKPPVIYVIGVLLCFYPYVFSSVFHLGSETLLLLFFFLITFLWVSKYKKTLPAPLVTCLLIQIGAWVVYAAMHSDSSYISRVFFIFLSALLLLLLVRKRLFFSFIDTYNRFIALQALLGVPVFFLYALGIIHPFAVFQNIDGRPLYFFGLTFSNSIAAGISRIAGFFDEPGALASWGIFALVFNKLTTNNRRVEIVLIVSLLFTLSVAYFIQLVLYFLFFYGTKVKTMMPVLLILGAIALFTYRFVGENEQLMYLTVERFQGGTIRSSRGEMTVDAKQIFLENPVIGIGAKELQSRGYFDDNPFEIPAKDGIIGLIITYLPILLVLLENIGNKKVLFGALILIAGYLQRPFHVNLLHYFMLYSFYLITFFNKVYVSKYGKLQSVYNYCLF